MSRSDRASPSSDSHDGELSCQLVFDRLLGALPALASILLLVMTVRVEASPYAFSMDRFHVVGNLPGDQVDEFDDGIVDPPWEILDPTVVEAAGLLTLGSPGTTGESVLDRYYIANEYSFIGSRSSSPFNVQDGEGDFTAVSTWVATVPGENEFYQMKLSYVIQEEPRRTIGIVVAVANFDPTFASFWGIPSGLGIEFRRVGNIPIEDFIWQHVPISEDDITGRILLRLNFDDGTDQFAADFSLDGGLTFESPFVPIGWGRGEPALGEYEWLFAGEAIREIRAIAAVPTTPRVGSYILALLLLLIALWVIWSVGLPLAQQEFGSPRSAVWRRRA